MKKNYDCDIIKKFFKGFEMAKNIWLVDIVNYKNLKGTVLTYKNISVEKTFHQTNSYMQNLFDNINKNDYIIVFTEKTIHLGYVTKSEIEEKNNYLNKEIYLFYELQDIVTINSIINKSIINYKNIESIKNLITITYDNQPFNMYEYFQNIVCKDCKNGSLEDILYTLYVEKMIVGKDNCKEEGQ